MAINSVAARNAYGIRDASPASRVDAIQKRTQLQDGLRELSDLTYSRNVAAQAQDPAAQAANSEAATTVFSQPAQSPQKLDETKVRSLLAEEEEAPSPLPSRGEIAGLAQRYLKITGSAETGKAREDKLKQLVDFYGASPERAQRLESLVNALEQGQEPEAAPSKNQSVAVA